MNGDYVARVIETNPINPKISEITITHSDFLFKKLDFSLTDETIGIDSNTVGIFDNDHFETDRKKINAGSIFGKLPHSVFTHVRNGSYPLATAKQNNKIVALKIILL